MEKALKIGLAFLFFLCLADMPYGYYQLVRMIALIGFSIQAYTSYQNDNPIKTILYIGLALLFQPLLKISLGRPLWNAIDVVIGVWLLISINFKKIKERN